MDTVLLVGTRACERACRLMPPASRELVAHSSRVARQVDAILSSLEEALDGCAMRPDAPTFLLG